MHNELVIRDLVIKVIHNKRLKHSYINVLPSGEIIVKTPVKSSSYIHKLIDNRYDWITQKLAYIKQYEKIDINLEDEVLIFGEVYSIDHHIAEPLRKKLERLKMPNETNVLACYDRYYKESAKMHIPDRVEYFSALMNLKPSGIRYRKMRRRWGSCDSKKELTFNINLLKLPYELIDYVIVHELAHIKHMNHSKQFHELVRNYLPDAKKLERQIREHFYRL